MFTTMKVQGGHVSPSIPRCFIGCYLPGWKFENIQYLGENENFMSTFGHIGQLWTWHIASNISHMANIIFWKFERVILATGLGTQWAELCQSYSELKPSHNRAGLYDSMLIEWPQCWTFLSCSRCDRGGSQPVLFVIIYTLFSDLRKALSCGTLLWDFV